MIVLNKFIFGSNVFAKAFVCADPEVSVTVFLYRPYPIMCKRGAVEWIVLENFEVIAIKPVQPVLCTNPDISVTILKNAKGLWLWQTIFEGEMIKLDGLPLTVLEEQ